MSPSHVSVKLAHRSPSRCFALTHVHRCGPGCNESICARKSLFCRSSDVIHVKVHGAVS